VSHAAGERAALHGSKFRPAKVIGNENQENPNRVSVVTSVSIGRRKVVSSATKPEKELTLLTREIVKNSSAGISVPGRVLIADDHKIMREGLRSLLEERKGEFECVGEAEDGYKAMIMAKELHPDIVIMDIAMPILNGIEATREIKEELPETKVIVLSMHANRAYVLQVLQAGASAYLLKDSAFEELSTALNAARRGEMYLSPGITEGGAVRNETGKPIQGAVLQSERLTKRELQVLQLIAEGKTTKEIAARLAVSVKTVETHRKQIMEKLEIRSIAGLTKFCIREGLTSL
jgi:two-component system, NarL family, response regulator NreC